MATKKDLYMYVESPEVLWRLNVTKLCKGGADLELVCDFRNCSSTTGGSPTGMGCMVVDSKLYMVGGANVVIDENDGSCKENFCLDAFAFDPTTDPKKEGLLVPVRDIPRLSGYKPRPIMVTLEGKIYLLSRHSYYSYLFELGLEAPHFEVFDPNPGDGGDRKWEILPNPLSFSKSGGDTILDYFAWGHRLGIYTQAGFCMFDASKNKWEDGTEFSSQFCVLDDLSFVPCPSGVGAEFEGFCIAMSANGDALIAYDFEDANGFLKSHWVLSELSILFNPRLEFCVGFVTHLGDGRMCFLYGGEEEKLFPGGRFIIRVAVFRVFKTVGVGGKPFLSVQIEHLQAYDLKNWNCADRVIESVIM
ncbi:hypothetical protein TEA_010315 [Camellia sinensis var. sinensis]|uniref:F-box associated domain-containing protein n=1 Tax=Camellia sinensis var. sinensis TaxID=542762 RepID=A0A4S4DFR0_CAMSN|nr:hypothetical protein TEA_010315 [Camellia sinensis var. sinensis]